MHTPKKVRHVENPVQGRTAQRLRTSVNPGYRTNRQFTRPGNRPLNAADANETIACHRKAQPLFSHVPPKPFSDLTIVVVEDHDDARRYLGLFLDHLGANVLSARNASEGLDAIKNNFPNMVLSDINMPGMDGFDLLRAIRDLGSDAGGSVPVIAMTALVTHADRARILNAGFQACLPKPFTPDKLEKTILTVLNK